MPWTVCLHSEFPIVETKYIGMLTQAELIKAAQATLALATTKETVLLLGDCSRLEGGHSLVDLFALAKNLGQTDLGFKVKEAVLVAADSPMLSQVQFWETTCFNRGICVRIFQDREEAIAWLCGFIPKVAKETEIS